MVERNISSSEKSDLLGVKEPYYLTETSPDAWMRRHFEKDIKNGFIFIDDIDQTSPRVRELIEYKQNLGEKFSLLREPVGLSRGIAESYMSRIPSGDLKPEFEEMILEVRRRTDYLEELEDVGIAAALASGFEDGKYGAWVRFFAPNALISRAMFKHNLAGVYLPTLDVAFFPNKLPTTEDMWLSLVDEGKLPREVLNLEHELTHDQQYTRGQRAMLILPEVGRVGGYYAIVSKYGVWTAIAFSFTAYNINKRLRERMKNDEVLAEIHAFEATASNPVYLEESLDEKGEIIDFVLRNYAEDVDQFEAASKAFDLVRSLRLLGLDDCEVGKLVSRARYDEDQRTYPKLEKRLETEKDNCGFERSRDFRLFLDALLSRQELELRVQRHSAQKIATEQLERAAGKKFG